MESNESSSFQIGRFISNKKRGKRSLRLKELHVPIANAQNILRKLKVEYQRLDAELVISSGYGQTEATTDGFKLTEHVASIFVDSKERKELLILFDTYKNVQRRNTDLKSPYVKELSLQLEDRIHQLLDVIEIVESTQINLRFGELDYELIWRLQQDPLVDRILTPQTRASLKISLGTIRRLRNWASPVVQIERESVHTEQLKVAF